MTDVFRKIHGAGNYFILFTVSTPVQHEPLVLGVCCYNSDGSMTSMCGNAPRCAAWTASHDLGETRMTMVMAGQSVTVARLERPSVLLTLPALLTAVTGGEYYDAEAMLGAEVEGGVQASEAKLSDEVMLQLREHARQAWQVLGLRGGAQHALTPGKGGQHLGVCISVTEVRERLVDVTEAIPMFRDFNKVIAGEHGCGLGDIARQGVALAWFVSAKFDGETVLPSGQVDL